MIPQPDNLSTKIRVIIITHDMFEIQMFKYAT